MRLIVKNANTIDTIGGGNTIEFDQSKIGLGTSYETKAVLNVSAIEKNEFDRTDILVMTDDTQTGDNDRYFIHVSNDYYPINIVGHKYKIVSNGSSTVSNLSNSDIGYDSFYLNDYDSNPVQLKVSFIGTVESPIVILISPAQSEELGLKAGMYFYIKADSSSDENHTILTEYVSELQYEKISPIDFEFFPVAKPEDGTYMLTYSCDDEGEISLSWEEISK